MRSAHPTPKIKEALYQIKKELKSKISSKPSGNNKMNFVTTSPVPKKGEDLLV